MNKTRTNKKGFTLIELIVVIAIIAILAAVAVPSYNAIQTKAEENTVLGNAAIIATNINAFNAFALTDDELTAVVAKSTIDTMAKYTTAIGGTLPLVMDATDYTNALRQITIAEDGSSTVASSYVAPS